MPKGWMFNNFIAGNKLSLDAGNPLSYPGTGTVWTDLSGSNNNGTLVNGVEFSPANGGVMSFDGVDDYVQLAQVIANPNILSISAWVYPATIGSTAGVIFGYRSGTTELIQLTIQTNGEIRFQIRGGNNILASINAAISMDVWSNVVAIFNKTTGIHNLYINNMLVGSAAQSITTLNSTQCIIGNTFGLVAPFKGQLNNIDIFDYPLTNQQKLDNFNALRVKYGI